MNTKRFAAAAFLTLATMASCKESTAPDPSTFQYDIEVRFYGPAMSDAQRQLFFNAADRIEQIITGDVVATARPSKPITLSHCDTISGAAVVLQEEVDDVLIFASIRNIDGPGKIIAAAGPCYTRATSSGDMTAIGVMFFDSADLNSISQGGSLQAVITHEMLHVIGVGLLWNTAPPDGSPPFRNLLLDTNTSNPKYVGARAREGCIASGGSSVCSSFVPVEGTPEPVGTRDAHWRENTFNNEMMTGYLDPTAPISAITVGSLQDLGYVVDASKADPYTVPSGGLLPATVGVTVDQDWERLIRPVGKLEVVSVRRR